MNRAVIVWGCSSGAGKSLLTAALCRWAANAGHDVAPYKAQNMSNNARVVPHPDGGGAEIGSAQAFQALAARVAPHIDHNPVLLKPEAETRSQVIVHGRVAPGLSAQPWRERSALLATAAEASLDRLAARHAVVVIEGAGSPAEINLAPQDYVNLGAARWARARVPRPTDAQAWLIADIDRGGAFAHGHGTWALLPDDLRPMLRGFVLNKFRGDAALLAPGPAQFEAATGVPVVGVLPYWRDLDLPDEDGWEATPAGAGAAPASAAGTGPVVAVVAPPQISNLDEFHPLGRLPGVQRRWARRPSDLDGADWIVLPGSKQVSSDLRWLRAQGLEAPIRRHVAAGRPLLGLCGGLQMLGRWLDDPDGCDGEAHGPEPGLGLLPLVTRYAGEKRLHPGRTRMHGLAGPWAAWSGRDYAGYEIRCGRTELLEHGAAVPAVEHGAAAPAVERSAAAPARVVATADDGTPLGWQCGPVLGLYAHGPFESAALQQALFGAAAPTLDAGLDRLAARLEAACGADRLRALFGAPPPPAEPR